MTTIYEFLRRPIFSTDHKVIGLQYAVTSMVFLLVGFALVILIRWQLAYPGTGAARVARQPWCCRART